MLEDALQRQAADHIVLTGDLTSNADARDLRTTRRLFETLGIMSASKLTIVPGNHDIYGGPHLAEELLGFPDRCKTTDYDEKLSIFQDTFSELFSDTIISGRSYTFLKRIRNVCFLGLNSNARHSLLNNPVGSNGEVGKPDRKEITELTKHHAWQTASQRIVLMHHHLFRRKDLDHLRLPDGVTSVGIAALLEQRTLKLHGKRHILKTFGEIGADMVLHGHVHFTAEYERHGIVCLNGAGAVHPISRSDGFNYFVIDVKPYQREISMVELPKKISEATVSSSDGNNLVTAAA